MRRILSLLLGIALLLAAQVAYAEVLDDDELPVLDMDHIGHVNFAEYYVEEGEESPLTPEEEASIIALQVMDKDYASMPMWLKVPDGEKPEDYMGMGVYFRVDSADQVENPIYYIPSRLEIISPIAYGTIDEVTDTALTMTPFYGAEPKEVGGTVVFNIVDDSIIFNEVSQGLTYEVVYIPDTMDIVELHRANG